MDLSPNKIKVSRLWFSEFRLMNFNRLLNVVKGDRARRIALPRVVDATRIAARWRCSRFYIARKFILDFIFHATHIASTSPRCVTSRARKRSRDKLFICRYRALSLSVFNGRRRDTMLVGKKRMISVEDCNNNSLWAKKIPSIFMKYFLVKRTYLTFRFYIAHNRQ